MLIDLVLTGKQALIVGEGKEPEYKALKLLDAEAKVTVMGSELHGWPAQDGVEEGRGGEPDLHQAHSGGRVLKTILETHPKVVFISPAIPT